MVALPLLTGGEGQGQGQGLATRQETSHQPVQPSGLIEPAFVFMSEWVAERREKTGWGGGGPIYSASSGPDAYELRSFEYKCLRILDSGER